jgi:hypothetical protein
MEIKEVSKFWAETIALGLIEEGILANLVFLGVSVTGLASLVAGAVSAGWRARNTSCWICVL